MKKSLPQYPPLIQVPAGVRRTQRGANIVRSRAGIEEAVVKLAHRAVDRVHVIVDETWHQHAAVKVGAVRAGAGERPDPQNTSDINDGSVINSSEFGQMPKNQSKSPCHRCTVMSSTRPIAGPTYARLKSELILGGRPSESGSKLQFFDRRMTLDGAVYYENWNGVQQAIELGCGFNFTENAGDAHVYGGEVEMKALITNELSISFGGGYTHAALTYRRDIGAALVLVASINDQFIDARHAALGNLPAYDVINAQIGAERGPWRVYLFGNNLTDKRILISDDNSLSLNIPSYNRISEGIPLTIGINANYKFSD